MQRPAKGRFWSANMGTTVKKMSVVQLTVLTAINMLGSGIVLLPSKLAQVGTISIFSWIVTALGSLALAYAFAKCGRFSRKPGGMGGYAEYAFGRSGNFMSNYTYGVSLLIANVAIAITAVGYSTELFHVTLTPIGVAGATVVLLWLTTIANSGMTGSIAANCTLIAVDGDNWLLHLDPAHSALFNATQQRRLNDALNQFHGRTLTLTMELIKPEQETPAQAASRRRVNRQREAEESIHGDPFIQQMMQQFGAVVRNDTIEPVDALVSQGK